MVYSYKQQIIKTMLNLLINYILNDTLFITIFTLLIINISIHYFIHPFIDSSSDNKSNMKNNVDRIYRFKDIYIYKSESVFKNMLITILNNLSKNQNKNQLFVLKIFEVSSDGLDVNQLTEPCLFYYDINNPLLINELFNKITWIDNAFKISENTTYIDIIIVIRKI